MTILQSKKTAPSHFGKGGLFDLQFLFLFLRKNFFHRRTKVISVLFSRILVINGVDRAIVQACQTEHTTLAKLDLSVPQHNIV